MTVFVKPKIIINETNLKNIGFSQIIIESCCNNTYNSHKSEMLFLVETKAVMTKMPVERLKNNFNVI
jgi:hypothetical protein